ncbi:MAG: hypothetical protein ABFS28_06295 [Bacteroidota bacterium]
MKPAAFPLKTSLTAFAVILLVHLLFFAIAQLNPPAHLSDSDDYLNASENLYKKGVLYCGDLSEPIIKEQFTRRPPLYPLLLGTVTLTGSKIPALLIQILISMTSIFVVFSIFLQNHSSQNPGKQAVIFATILLLATPAQFIYSNRIMAELLFQLILVGMAWSVYRHFESRESRYIWMFHLFLSLGVATKPVLYPFALLSIILSLALFLRTKKKAFILAICLPVVWIGLYSIGNYKRTGSAQYSSIQTANLVNYNLRYFLMGQEGSEYAAAEVDLLYEVCGDESGYREKNKCLEKGVRNIVLDRPLQYGLYHLKGSLRYFIDPGRFDLVTYFNLEEPDSPGILYSLNQEGIRGVFKFIRQEGWALIAVLVLIALFKLVKITGFILYLLREKSRLPFRIFLAILVGYLALVTGPLGASRFLLPAELFLIGGAVLGWSSLILKNPKAQES